MSIKISQLQNFSLAGSGVSIGDVTMTLSSFQTIDGVNLAMTDFGSKGYITVEPGSRDREEQISFSGVTQNANGTATLTGVKTVLFLSPYTETSGVAKSHPGGVIAVVTNTSGFYNEFGIKENNETLTGFWEAPNPLTTQGVATKGYVDNLVSGGNVSVSALIEVGTAGETVSAGNPVYLKAADGRWWKATGSTANTVNIIQLGIAQGAGTAGNNITGGVLRRGTDTHQSGGSAGTIGYISNTSTIATSAGTTERAVGNFITATTFNFNPDFYYIPTADQKGAFVGTGGTPSATNPFVTNNGTSLVTTFLVSGTWTKSSQSVGTQALIECWGAGGSGGSRASVAASGGGGGGYSSRLILLSSLGATETVTIGAGGVGVTGSSNGNAGGNTTFGSWLTAYGGGAGSFDSAQDASGGGGGGPLGVGGNGTQGTGIGNAGAAGSPGFPITSEGSFSTVATRDAMTGAGGGGGYATANAGGNSFSGGGGGGAAVSGVGHGAGGTSKLGGNGGAGNESGSGVAGTQPGGGGGGTMGGTSGAGAAGQVKITTF